MIIIIAPWLIAVIGLVVFALSKNKDVKWLAFAAFCIGLFYAIGGLPAAIK